MTITKTLPCRLLHPIGKGGVGSLQPVADTVLRLPGISGNYLSTPDTAGVSITGDIDIRVRVAPDTWVTNGSFICKRAAASRSWAFNGSGLGTGGLLYAWSANGTTWTGTPSSTTGHNFAVGNVKWIRVTHDVDNGAAGNDVKFYTSTDGITWVQLGATITTAGVTSIADSAAPLEAMSSQDGAADRITGHLYYAEVRSGINGPVVAKFDPSTIGITGDRTPATHTTPSVAEAIRLPGVAGNYLSQPDSAANSVTGDIDIRVRVALDDWSPATSQVLASKWATTGNQRAWRLHADPSGILIFSSSSNGTTEDYAGSSVHSFADGSTQWVRVTWAAASGVVSFYKSSDGATWDSLGTGSNPHSVLFDSTAAVVLGAESQPALYAAGLVYEAYVLNGINGTVVASFNAAGVTPTAMRTPATAGAWTINGAAWSWESASSAPSAGALRLPGVAGNYVSTPDAADISIVGDIDLRAKVTMDDWTPAAETYFVGKWAAGGQSSYLLALTPAGNLKLYWSENGAASKTATSTVITGLANGDTKWVRVTLDVDNGAVGHDVKFYTSDDGVTWAQLGATVTTALTTSIFVSTSIVEIGSIATGGPNGPLAAYVHRAEVRSGIDGAIVASFDAANVAITDTKLPTTVVQSGRTWTINGSLWSWVQVPDPTEWTITGSNWWWATSDYTPSNNGIVLDEQYVYFPGTSGNYASTPDSAALSIVGDIDLRAKVQLDNWSTGIIQSIISKYVSSGNLRSYRLYVSATGSLNLVWSTDGTTGTTISRGSTALGYAPGTLKWVRATLDVDNGSSLYEVKFYTSDDGVTWTQLGSTLTSAVTSIADTTAAVEIGSAQVGALELLAGKVYYAEIRNGIGGTIVGQFNPYLATVTAIRTPTTVTAFSGSAEVWTMNGSAWEWTANYSRLISAPDSAALSITGDIDIRAKATLGSWILPGQALVDKRTGFTGYTLRISSGTALDGRLQWAHGDGTASLFATSSVGVPFTAGQTGWVRATLDVDNGAVGWDVKFYTSTDGVTWVQLGATVTTALTTSIADGTAPLSIGSTVSGAQRSMGIIHYAEVRNGIAGTVVAVFDPNAVKPASAQSPTTVPSRTGEVYTITGSGWSWSAP